LKNRKGEKSNYQRRPRIEEQGLLIFREKVDVMRDEELPKGNLHAYIRTLPYWDILTAGRRFELVMRNYSVDRISK